jgi:transposase
MVRRMLGPGAITAAALAEETGVSQPTLSRWLKETANMKAMRRTEKTQTSDPPGRAGGDTGKRAQDWTAIAKLRAVVEATELSGDALGAYLRRKGLHQDQLTQWQQKAESGLEGHTSGRRPERKRIKQLEKELRHKEKALAETAALLVLRKKVNALWGDADDDTDERNEP